MPALAPEISDDHGPMDRFRTDIRTAFLQTNEGTVDLEAETSAIKPFSDALAMLADSRRRILFPNKNSAAAEGLPGKDGVVAVVEPLGYTIAPEVDSDGKPRLTITLQSSRGPQREPWTDKGRRRLTDALALYLSVPVSIGFGAILRQQLVERIGGAMRVGSSFGSDYTTTMIVDRDRTKEPQCAAAKAIGDGPFVVLPGHAMVDNKNVNHSTVYYPHDQRSIDNEAAKVRPETLTAYDPEHGVSNTLDCSLATVTATEASVVLRFSKKIIGYKTLTPADRGLMVFICRHDGAYIPCRISGLGIDAVLVGQGASLHPYLGMFTIETLDTLKPATHAGDSGAPIVLEENGGYMICGMVVGGSDRNFRGAKPQTIALPIDRVLDYYGVKPRGSA